MATKLEFLVAKLKVVLALATVSVAISSPELLSRIFIVILIIIGLNLMKLSYSSVSLLPKTASEFLVFIFLQLQESSFMLLKSLVIGGD